MRNRWVEVRFESALKNRRMPVFYFLLTRQLNITSSAAVCLPTARRQNAAVAPPTASFDNAVRRQAHGGLSVKYQNVRGFKNALDQGVAPLVRATTPSKGIIEALNSIYLVADEMVSSHSTNRRQCAMMELLLTIKEAGE
ncbi:MAG: hypothetical protein KZQ95_13690, partial [Candidatus Thiodiazotropha sp. (ex Epidulcina cf. delphinae)]|nr:hypothetical protein [Candidatus Thiodiazotropha sp. (ex Epidulcina cf. delphinae)]